MKKKDVLIDVIMLQVSSEVKSPAQLTSSHIAMSFA